MSWPLFHTLFLAQQPQCCVEAYNCRAAPSHLPLHLLFLWSFISAVWSYFALSLGRGHLSSHLPQAEDSSVHRAAGHVDPSKWGMLYLSQEKRQKMCAGDTDRALFLSHVKELHWIMFFKANPQLKMRITLFKYLLSVKTMKTQEEMCWRRQAVWDHYSSCLHCWTACQWKSMWCDSGSSVHIQAHLLDLPCAYIESL